MQLEQAHNHPKPNKQKQDGLHYRSLIFEANVSKVNRIAGGQHQPHLAEEWIPPWAIPDASTHVSDAAQWRGALTQGAFGELL